MLEAAGATIFSQRSELAGSAAAISIANAVVIGRADFQHAVADHHRIQVRLVFLSGLVKQLQAFDLKFVKFQM